MKTINQLRASIKAEPARGAWKRGVKVYALELIDDLDPSALLHDRASIQRALLNGADDWQQYSEGGSALI